MSEFKKKELPISCICSIYNKTILKELLIAIDSLIVQEYIPNEIVIIVDGIVNKEIIYLLDYLVKSRNIFKVFYIEQNRGLGYALKFGLTKCSNKLIARFDSDDINLENRLKIQYEIMKNNSNISITGSNVIEFNPTNKELFEKKMSNKFKYYMIRNPLNHPSVLFRKDDIIKVGSYRDIELFEDYELWLRCIKNGLNIFNTNENLVAMKRSSFLANRIGFKYALCEFNFIKHALKYKLIKKLIIPLYIIRIFLRFLPHNIAKLILFTDTTVKISTAIIHDMNIMRCIIVCCKM